MHVVCKLLLDSPIFDDQIGVDVCQVRCVSQLYKKTNYVALRTFESIFTITREELHQLRHHISTVRFDTYYLPMVDGRELPADSLACALHLRASHDEFMGKIDESIRKAKDRILESYRPLTPSEHAELAHFRAAIHSPMPRQEPKRVKFTPS